MEPQQITDTFVALGGDGRAEGLPVGPTFWPDLIAGKFGRFDRMISAYRFEKDWDNWERHPAGEEFVCLIEGSVELWLDTDAGIEKIVLDKAGGFALVPRNTWHTAKVHTATFMIFVTAGEGTQHRPA